LASESSSADGTIQDKGGTYVHVPDGVLRRSAGRARDLRRHLPEITVDAARKVVGVGSVGTRCFVVVGEGRAELDPLILQVKEAEPSVLEPDVGRSAYRHAGEVGL
jgi:uncharacterized protein DUF2252